MVQQLINCSTKLIGPRADGLEIGVKEIDIDKIEKSPIVIPEENNRIFLLVVNLFHTDMASVKSEDIIRSLSIYIQLIRLYAEYIDNELSIVSSYFGSNVVHTAKISTVHY